MPMTRRSMCRYVCVTTLVLTPCLAACVTPKSDYNDFLDRTADARAPMMMPVVDASSFEAAPMVDAPGLEAAPAPSLDFQGEYYMACLASIAGPDPTLALAFKATIDVMPIDGGGSSAMTLTTLALQSVQGSTPVPPTSLSQTAPGAVMSTATGTVSANGVGDVIYALSNFVPGSDDPVVPGSEVDFNAGGDYSFHITSTAAFCAGYTAYTSRPIPMQLTAASNPCIFRLPNPDGALPVFMASDFHCP
jgi:hypothetical protein